MIVFDYDNDNCVMINYKILLSLGLLGLLLVLWPLILLFIFKLKIELGMSVKKKYY